MTRYLVLTTVSLLIACSSTSPSAGPSSSNDAGSGDAGARANSGGDASQNGGGSTINIAANDSLTTQLDDQIAKILLEEHLGMTVQLVATTSAAQWDSLRAGTLDVSLEVSPSTSPDQMAKLKAGDPQLEDGGLLGPIVKPGWFIPTYMLAAHPELATWQGLKDPANVSLFQTPASGTKGSFLGGSPSWVQYDQQIIDNLGLSFTVTFAGSEDAVIAELDAQYNRRGPLLFHLWTPEWAFAKYDITMVQLPPYTDACWAKADSVSGPDCDYPTDRVFKLFSSQLKTKSPIAYQLLKNVSFTNKDQISMMGDVKVKNLSVEQAARNWLDANATLWQGWLKN